MKLRGLFGRKNSDGTRKNSSKKETTTEGMNQQQGEEAPTASHSGNTRNSGDAHSSCLTRPGADHTPNLSKMTSQKPWVGYRPTEQDLDVLAVAICRAQTRASHNQETQEETQKTQHNRRTVTRPTVPPPPPPPPPPPESSKPTLMQTPPKPPAVPPKPKYR